MSEDLIERLRMMLESADAVAVHSDIRDAIAALTAERQAREQANQDYRMLHDSLLAEIKAKVQAEQERDRLRERLARHLTEKDDPCQDRGASWPCDVARALLGLEEPQ